MGKRNIDSSINNRNKIPKLTSFGITTSETIESKVETFNDDKENTHVAKKGKFLESWKFNRSWLTYDSEKHPMFCNNCIRVQAVNVFTTWCSMMKREAVTIHENRKGDHSHKRTIEIFECSNSMIESRKRAMLKSKSAVIGALRNVYVAAINNLANVTVPDLNDFCIQHGASQLKHLKVPAINSSGIAG